MVNGMESGQTLGWEPVVELPVKGALSEGAYRSRVENVVAVRDAATEREQQRMRLWPADTRRSFANRVVLTREHIYVERLDGELCRIARTALRSRKMDSIFVEYVMEWGESLTLIPRANCEVIATLEAQLRDDDAKSATPYRKQTGPGLGISALIGVPAAFLLVQLLQELAFGPHRAGTTTGALLSGVLVLAVLLFGVARLRIDDRGVRQSFGVLPWFRKIHTRNTLSALVVVPRVIHGADRVQTGWELSLLRKDGRGAIALPNLESSLERAEETAARLGVMLGVEVAFPKGRVAPWKKAT